MAKGGVDTGARRARFAPYGLLSPGVLWLILFFLVPVLTLVRTSLSERPNRFLPSELTFSWDWSNYSDSLSKYSEQFLRSFFYAGVATALCIAIGYPLAYVIAFRGGRYKNLLLGLVVIPFFTTYLIRTIAWKTILGDEGQVVSILRDLGVLGPHQGLLATPGAVIGGLTYNFLPFMVLPIYVSLEKIDRDLVAAANDLYATPARAFWRVVFPLSLPGVFAGSLLTFIPASGDFINAEFLGSPKTAMIGNVVQNQFLVQLDYPTAAALSITLMVIITVMVLIYARFLGTEDLTG
jgi:spermidine/putrescine transport system permease protein